MLKIWTKTLLDKKIKNDYIHITDNLTKSKDFCEVLRDICEKMDIPTPLLLNIHTSNFEKFKQCKFRKSEFIESVDFDEMILENISE